MENLASLTTFMPELQAIVDSSRIVVLTGKITITPEVKPFEKADSLMLVEVGMEVEDKFDVTVPDKTAAAFKGMSVRECHAELCKLKGIQPVS